VIAHFSGPLRLAAICGALLLLAGCLRPLFPPPSSPDREASVGGASFSPDGRFLRFGYTVYRGDVRSSGDRQIDWRTGQITRIDPEPFPFKFTEDANTVFRVLLDDNPNRLKQIAQAIALYDYPSFQLKRTIALSKMPEDDPYKAERWSPWKQVDIVDVNLAARQALCTFSGRLGQTGLGLCLYDLGTGKYTVLVPPQEGFGTIFSRWIVGRDDVFFAGWDPQDERLKADIKDLLTDPDAFYKPDNSVLRFTTIPYRVRTGSRPEITYRDILKRGAALGGWMPTSYAASCGGKRVAFISMSPDEDEPIRKAQRERVGRRSRLDVYVRDGDSQRAVTNLKTYMGRVAISCDGSAVAFGTYIPTTAGSDPLDEHWSRRLFEPSVVDLATNRVVPLRLVDRLKNELGITKD
jgi:hypothetical protein